MKLITTETLVFRRNQQKRKLLYKVDVLEIVKYGANQELRRGEIHFCISNIMTQICDQIAVVLNHFRTEYN